MSTLNVSNISDGSNSTNVENLVRGSATAWVNFNGTGTVAIRDSYNVNSITDEDTGRYRVNFTNAMANTNYCVMATTSKHQDGDDGNCRICVGDNGSGSSRIPTTTSFPLTHTDRNGSHYDSERIYAAVFSN